MNWIKSLGMVGFSFVVLVSCGAIDDGDGDNDGSGGFLDNNCGFCQGNEWFQCTETTQNADGEVYCYMGGMVTECRTVEDCELSEPLMRGRSGPALIC